jgi:hypothetical protein
MGSRVDALRAPLPSVMSLRSVDFNLFSTSTSSAHGCFPFIFISVIAAFSAPTFLVSFSNRTILGVILYSFIPVHQLMGMPLERMSVHTNQHPELSRQSLPQCDTDSTAVLYFSKTLVFKRLFSLWEAWSPAFLLSRLINPPLLALTKSL